MSLRLTESEYAAWCLGERVSPASSRGRTAGPRFDEHDFQNAVITLAGLCGWLWYHPFDSRRSPAGYPDLTLVKPGRPIIFSELKSRTGRATPAQLQWLEALRQATGVEAHLWRPSDWDEIASLLQQR